MNSQLHIVILGAGKGTRMRSMLPKVLQKLAGKSLLEHIINTSVKLNPKHIHIIYGHGGDLVRNAINVDCKCLINLVEQGQQLGTGHAVQQVLPHLPKNAKVLILYGDAPLISLDTLQKLLQTLDTQDLTVLTAILNNPTGYGRIIRSNSDSQNNITAIIEDKDVSEIEKNICEVNSGIIATTSEILHKYLSQLQPRNQQGEFYLTDVISLAIADNKQVTTITTDNELEIIGVNTKTQLAQLERSYQKQLVQQLMEQGATVIDPNRLDIRGEVKVNEDVTFDINVILDGNIVIGANSTIGANCCLKNVIIGSNVEIRPNCVIEGAIIENHCIIGPFARIRPQSNLAQGSHVGNFVEIKNSSFGQGTKVNHLSYIGDATVGNEVNVGAGTITCNYDGANKYHTIIGDRAFIGSGCELVAPIKVGHDATIGAGSTLNYDAPAGKLTLTRAKQTVIANWQRPTKHDFKERKRLNEQEEEI